MSPAGAIDFTVGETVSQNLFKTASGDIATITGRVVSVDTSNSKIIIDIPNFTPTTDDFICFAKSNIINASSLKGYYAETTFVNNSKEKAELFGVTAEIQQSSK